MVRSGYCWGRIGLGYLGITRSSRSRENSWKSSKLCNAMQGGQVRGRSRGEVRGRSRGEVRGRK